MQSEIRPLSETEFAALRRRHEAALRLLRSGEAGDPALLLSYVLWPSQAVVEALERVGAAA